MGTQSKETMNKILEAGKREFLGHGYENASMRRIAREANVTTGAIYGYFPGKEALFAALTEDVANQLLDMYIKAHKDFAQLPPEEQVGQLEEITDQYIPQMLHFIYDHLEEFKLVFCCGAAGSCDKYIGRLAEVEEKSSWDFIASMKKMGKQVEEMDSTIIHILSRSFFQQLLEFVSHDVPREKALHYAVLLGRFQHAGWAKIMGL